VGEEDKLYGSVTSRDIADDARRPADSISVMARGPRRSGAPTGG
jgi:ribosomal protein L9